MRRCFASQTPRRASIATANDGQSAERPARNLGANSRLHVCRCVALAERCRRLHSSAAAAVSNHLERSRSVRQRTSPAPSAAQTLQRPNAFSSYVQAFGVHRSRCGAPSRRRSHPVELCHGRARLRPARSLADATCTPPSDRAAKRQLETNSNIVENGGFPRGFLITDGNAKNRTHADADTLPPQPLKGKRDTASGHAERVSYRSTGSAVQLSKLVGAKATHDILTD